MVIPVSRVCELAIGCVELQRSEKYYQEGITLAKKVSESFTTWIFVTRFLSRVQNLIVEMQTIETFSIQI